MQKYAKRNMHKYAQICKLYAILCIDPTFMDLKRKYANICTKYANICRNEIYMQNIQTFALPTLLM